MHGAHTWSKVLSYHAITMGIFSGPVHRHFPSQIILFSCVMRFPHLDSIWPSAPLTWPTEMDLVIQD